MAAILSSSVAARTLALIKGLHTRYSIRPTELQLARWHWLQLARQRYLLNSAIQLFYPSFSIPNDFMLEFFL